MEDSLSGVPRLRQLGLVSPRAAERALQFPESAARRLSLEAVLRGHHGCVNRVCWNERGSLLASGSDDRKVMLWSYPDTQRQPIALETEHQANIFGVRFLPQTNDARLVTGAMDYTVQLHQLETPPADVALPVRSGGGTSRRHPNAASAAGSVRSVVYTCHRSRVKDVAVEPLNPHLFWSAAEDGMVRQYDTRVPTGQQRDYESPNMLLAIKSKGRLSELKSLNVNPTRPHQLAVGAADPFLRIYDRRMLTPGPPERGRPPAAPMLSLAPPHLALCSAGGGSGRYTRMHSTYVSFGSRGDKVVATYHGDHAYCFDITGAQPPSLAAAGTSAAAAEAVAGGSAAAQPPIDLFAHPVAAAALAAAAEHRRRGAWAGPGSPGSNGYAGSSRGGGEGMGDMPGMLPAAAERAKADGNLHLFSKKYYEAVRQYSEAIQLAPWSPALYTNRALALLQRGWEGDALCALRDAETAVCLDPSSAKAHYRRCQALRAAGMLQSASTAVRLFRQHFPERAGDVEGLEEQIAADTTRQAQQAELRRQQAEQRRQLRRRRGLQFDRERRERRERRQERTPAEAEPAGPAAEAAAAAGQQHAAEAGPGAAGGAEAGPSPAAAAGPSSAAAAAAAGPSTSAGGGGGAAGSAEGGAGAAPAAAASPASAPASTGDTGGGGGGDSWDTLYASASSDDELEEDATSAASAAAASSGIDAAYAAALEAAAAGPAGDRPEGAAAGAPGVDALSASLQQQQEGEGGEGGKGQGARQPSLWSAFEGGRRLLQRYVGQCNLQTDIKEACFLGAADELVAAGSDDGRVFIFCAATGECVRVIMADEDVANAVQPHPNMPVLATSGIESTIKLWSPEGPPTTGGDISEIIRRNQDRVKEGAGPTVLRGVDPRIIAALTDNPGLLRALVQRATQRPNREPGEGGGEGAAADADEEDEDEDEDEDESDVREVNCRVA